MGNVVLAFPDFTQADAAFAAVVADGGSFSDMFPLKNVFNPKLNIVARTTDTALQSTQFNVDLGVLRNVRGVFIPKSNASRNAQYRIRGFNTKDGANTVTRPSLGTYLDQNGYLQTAQPNIPRLSYRNALLMTTAARINYVLNSTAQGAVVGSPGTFPTGWGQGVASLTQHIVATGIDAQTGLAYFDVRFNGTTTSTQSNIRIGSVTDIFATVGQNWTISECVMLVAGSQTGITFQLGYFEIDSGSNIVGAHSSAAGAIASSGLLSAARITLTAATVISSCAYVWPSLWFNWASGAAVDFTIRIAATQAEAKNAATAFIPTISAAAGMPAGYTVSGTPSYLQEVGSTNVIDQAVSPGFLAVASTDIMSVIPGAPVWEHLITAGSGTNLGAYTGLAVTPGLTYAAAIWVFVPSAYNLSIDGGPIVNIDIGTLGAGGSNTAVQPFDPTKTDQWQRIISVITPGSGASSSVNLVARRATPYTGGSLLYTSAWSFEQTTTGTATSTIQTSGGPAARATETNLTLGVTAYDSGWSDVYNDVYPLESLYWGDPSLWDGKIPDEELSLYPMPIVEVFDPVVAQYWLVEFNDTNNAAGYLQISRIILAGGWQPTINMEWGATIVVEDPSTVQPALGGAEYFFKIPKRRVVRFTLPFLTDDDAMSWVFDMQTRLGQTEQLFFVHDPDDRMNMHRRSFLTRPRVVSPLDYAGWLQGTAPFELQEILV